MVAAYVLSFRSPIRYVQEAAIADPSRAATAGDIRLCPVQPDTAQAGSSGNSSSALDQVRAVVADCFRGQGVLVHNVRSKLAHKPCATECSCQRNPCLLPGFVLSGLLCQ